MKILLTTTSFQDTPGAHHALLASSGFTIIPARGPLNEAQMLTLIAEQGPLDGTGVRPECFDQGNHQADRVFGDRGVIDAGRK